MRPSPLATLHTTSRSGTLPHTTQAQLTYYCCAGQPSQLNLALHGASYKTFFTLNDSIAIQVADPPGSALVTLGFILVDVRPGHDGIGHDSGAVVTTSLVVFLLIALCGLELYKTLHNLCHPETTERQAHERFENWMDKLEEAGARVTKASDQYEKLDNEVNS